jgi:hypothetical protein
MHSLLRKKIANRKKAAANFLFLFPLPFHSFAVLRGSSKKSFSYKSGRQEENCTSGYLEKLDISESRKLAYRFEFR